MKLLTLIFLMVTCFGCQIFGGKNVTSEWIILDDADSISCSSWPLGPKDLDLTQIKVLHGEQTALIASGRSRNGAPIHYYAAFDGDVDLEHEELKPLPLGRGALVAGGGKYNRANLIAVIKNSSTKAGVELRNVSDNIIRHKGTVSKEAINDAFFKVTEKNAWLTLGSGDDKYKLSFFKKHKSKVGVYSIKNISFQNRPLILSTPRSNDVLTVSFKDGESSTKTAFTVRRITETGKVSESHQLLVPVSENIESWTAVSQGLEHYIAYVDGDSLIGQATLRVVSFSWNDGMPKLIWKRETPLSDVHVSEPVIVKDENAAHVLLQQWVDKESTVASYKIGIAKLHPAEYKGIFPKGTRIIDAFSYGKKKEPFAILRYREGTSWKFELCELD